MARKPFLVWTKFSTRYSPEYFRRKSIGLCATHRAWAACDRAPSVCDGAGQGRKRIPENDVPGVDSPRPGSPSELTNVEANARPSAT